jgi:hypothetical protein
LATFMLTALGLALAIAFAAVGRWVYFHPERLYGIAFGDLLPKPLSNFFLRFAKLFGAFILFVGMYGVASRLLILLFRALRSSDFNIFIFVAISSLLALLATLSLLRRVTFKPATED